MALENQQAADDEPRLGLRRALGIWFAAASAGWLSVVCIAWLVTQAF